MKYVVMIAFILIFAAGIVGALKPTTEDVMEIRLYMNNSNSVIHIPATNPYNVPASSISFTDLNDADLKHRYVSAEYNDMVSGLVFYSGRFKSLWVNKTTNGYVMVARLGIIDSKVFIPITKGGWHTIEGKMEYVEGKTLLNKEKPSFYFGLGNGQEIMIYTGYDNIDIESNVTSIGKGYQRLVIENMGTSGNKIRLDIRRV